MPFQIIRSDITTMKTDAIVNAANETLLGGGGVDGAIHRAAGPELLAACRTLGGCRPGEAKLTSGFRLPCRYIIHTVGPIWQDGAHGEAETLAACYRNSLELARAHRCRSIAFPLISSGAYGYPKDLALQTAVHEISRFLLTNEMQVTLVVFDSASFQLSRHLLDPVRSFIDENYVRAHTDVSRRREVRFLRNECFADMAAMQAPPGIAPEAVRPSSAARPQSAEKPGADLKEKLSQLDEGFSAMLLRKIDERGMTDAECYKRANIDRKLFSKIRSSKTYRPSKPTVLAFAIALELSLEETQDMLRKAGFALSHSSKFDIIVEYFIVHGNYNIFELNETLFAFDQCLLGA